MQKKINVGILGATGIVGQYFIKLLQNHPWFTVTYLAASAKSAGKSYAEAVQGRWCPEGDIPAEIGGLPVADAQDIRGAAGKCSLVFSCIKLENEAVKTLESGYAQAGFAVVSANSGHRGTADVPVLIPEINPGHLDVIPAQRSHYGWGKGLIIVKPNCSLQSFLTPLYALIRAGYALDKVLVTTLQGISGAGYPGHSALDLLDNTLPLPGEEIKSEMEPLKILGSLVAGKIVANSTIGFSAHCNRVAVIHGHTACVSFSFKGKKPAAAEIISIWKNFRALPQELGLPMAPGQPIIYHENDDRPQPRRDRDSDKGMAITAGRLRQCPVLDYKFSCVSNNIVRGAAGGAILSAELLAAQNYIPGLELTG